MTATRTPASYYTSGNSKHWQTPAYRRTSTNGAKLERTPTHKLIWHGMGGGLFLFACGAVAILAIVAFAGGTP